MYWFLLEKNLKLQNIFILFSSYLFYGWWDWRFLGLIFLSSVVDYTLGMKIFETEDTTKRKRLLWVSVLVNIGMLLLFKYFNFFSDSLSDFFLLFGIQLDFITLNLILPVGISFYTFQTLSYTIDIYRKKLEPAKDPIQFFAFVSFFPQLVAGPIEKARDLLPQFGKVRIFKNEDGKDALRQILWGLFKKVAIADNAAVFANLIFENPEAQPSSMLILGLILFSFQIYGDFSGYSDMAIGFAKLLGFRLSQNFNFPFFSTSMSELWRKWHISLSTWTGEYIFLPISKNKKAWGRLGVVYALFCTFLILGFWHGAKWTFICFGMLHGSVVAFEYYFKKHIKRKDNFLKSKVLSNFSGWFVTITLWLIGMLFFRAIDISHAFTYLNGIFENQFFPDSIVLFFKYKLILFLILILMLIEWINRKKEFGLDIKNWKFTPLRWGVYYSLTFIMLRYSGSQQDFIYFQF